MKKILMIDTGGTFNKVYNPISGELEVPKTAHALKNISSKWLHDFNIEMMIGKDSLDITNRDRMELLSFILKSKYENIIIIHGTDTMSHTAEYLAESDLEKTIILTGAMVPFSIDPVEATANVASAYGYLQMLDTKGVYIAMNGNIDHYENVKKDREKGRFVCGA